MKQRTTPNNAWQAFRRIYWTLAAAMAIVLVLLAAMGFGPGGRHCKVVAGTASADGAAAVAVGLQPAERYACRIGGATLRPGA